MRGMDHPPSLARSLRRSVRTLLYGSFLSSALLACGVRGGDDGVPPDRAARIDRIDDHVMGADADGADYVAAMDALKAQFPKTHAYIHERGVNRYLLQTSAVRGTNVNQFTVKNMKRLLAALDDNGGRMSEHDADMMAMDVLALFEGVRYQSYDDSEGKRTIGRGILMPTPGDQKKQDLIQMIRDAADGAKYSDIYEGRKKLNPAREKDLAIAWLKMPGHHLNVFKRAVSDAGADYNAIPAPLRALMLSMVWQTNKVLKRDPSVTDPLLRTMADKNADMGEKLDAFDAVNFYYMDQCLLKNFNDAAFSDPASRIALARRPMMIAVAANALRTNIANTHDLDAAAAAPVPARYVASLVRAMQRDSGGEALMIHVGNMDASYGDLLLDPSCGWVSGARNRLVAPLASAVFTQKTPADGGAPFWECVTKKPDMEQGVLRSDTLRVEFADVIADVTDSRTVHKNVVALKMK